MVHAAVNGIEMQRTLLRLALEMNRDGRNVADAGAVVGQGAAFRAERAAHHGVPPGRDADRTGLQGDPPALGNGVLGVQEQVDEDLRVRDKKDRTRKIAPLKIAKDAIYIGRGF